MESTDKERDKILDRIRALLAKTVENGCTEQEAVSAAAMVSRLLDKYDLDLSDVERRARSEFATSTHPVTDDIGERLWKPASAIQKLTGTRYWTDSASGGICFFGRDCDVEIATYLIRICERTMRDQTRLFEVGNALMRPTVRRSRRIAFLDGMANSLRRKLEEIAEARRASSTGRALVIVKDEMLDDEMKRQQIVLYSTRARRSRDLDKAYQDGEDAASGTRFDDGLRSDASDLAELES